MCVRASAYACAYMCVRVSVCRVVHMVLPYLSLHTQQRQLISIVDALVLVRLH